MRSKKGWTEEERNREEVGSNEDLIILDYRNGEDRSACERHRQEHTHIEMMAGVKWQGGLVRVCGRQISTGPQRPKSSPQLWLPAIVAPCH